MSVKLRPISEQVIVITGASSGIGLATAKIASEKGARLVLSSRVADDLRDLVSEIRQKGGDAVYVVADVANVEEVDWIAERALAEFGRFDSWINAESFSVFGKLTEVPLEEKRRMFEINFWGVVHCCRAAVKSMKSSGGAIINIGSAEFDRNLIVHGMQSAALQAVKSYLEVLNKELDGENIPISVSLLEPAFLESDLVAKQILNRCEQPRPIGETKKSYTTIEKSCAVAVGLGVAAFAAYKAIQNARQPGDLAH